MAFCMAQKFSIGVSSCTWWVGARIRPPFFPNGFEPFRNLLANLGGRSKGQGVLLVDGPPKAEPCLQTRV